MALAKGQVRKISRQVYKQFPELSGTEPKVRLQTPPARNGGSAKQPKAANGAASERYLLTFSARSKLPNGRAIVRVVRVIADAQGSVVKITTSR